MAHRHRKPNKRRLHISSGCDPNPVEAALNRIALLSPTEQANVLASASAGFDAFRQGQGNHTHWCALADAMNVAQALAELRIASNHAAAFSAAHQALVDVMDRATACSTACASWTLRGGEIAALDHALFMHRIQLQHCSRGELSSAVTNVVNRMRQALAGNAGKGTRVVDGAAFFPTPSSAPQQHAHPL
jgi:hypothetical protein